MKNNEEVDWDHLYEEDRDCKDIVEEKKKESCDKCKKEFEEEDLDFVKGELLCRECENEI